MKKQFISFSGILILFLALVGCAATTIDSNERIDWHQVRSISVLPPQQDQWNLAELIQQKLATMNIVSIDNRAQADLVITFSPAVTEDLTQDSQRVTRLRSLHLDFFKPGSEVPITRIDYEFPLSVDLPDAAAGIDEIFAELSNTVDKHEVVTIPTAITEPEEVPTTQQVTEPKTRLGHTAQGPVPTDNKQEAQQTTKQGPTEKPSTQTPPSWTPRFKSWGLAEWGKDPDNESY